MTTITNPDVWRHALWRIMPAGLNEKRDDVQFDEFAEQELQRETACWVEQVSLGFWEDSLGKWLFERLSQLKKLSLEALTLTYEAKLQSTY